MVQTCDSSTGDPEAEDGHEVQERLGYPRYLTLSQNNNDRETEEDTG